MKVVYRTSHRIQGCETDPGEGMTQKIIGLVGYAGSGKSTVSRYLEAHVGFTTYRFAGILKDMLKVLGLSHEEVDGDRKELPCHILGGKTPRWAMQTLGTEWGRVLIDNQLWVRSLMLKIERDGESLVVIDDVRFPEEVQAVHACGGEIWLIHRPGVTPEHTHVSESHVPSIQADKVILNDGSFSDLLTSIQLTLS